MKPWLVKKFLNAGEIMHEALKKPRKMAETVKNARAIIQHEINISRDPARKIGLESLRRYSITPRMALSRALKARLPKEYEHSVMVADLSAQILRELKRTHKGIWLTERGIRKRALLHDIGKLGVKKSVLSKKGALSAADRAELDRHIGLGADLARGVFPKRQFEVTAKHHEHLDGTGKIIGIAGAKAAPRDVLNDSIPLEVRIVAVADSLCAAVGPKEYKDVTDAGRRKIRAVLAGMRKQKGKYDQNVVDALQALLIPSKKYK